MMIRRIAEMDPDLYYNFCTWLRNDYGTPIGILIKDTGYVQNRVLNQFLISRKEKQNNESNKNSL